MPFNVFITRFFISPTALFVNVNASNFLKLPFLSDFKSVIKYCLTKVNVLPLPAEAL